MKDITGLIIMESDLLKFSPMGMMFCQKLVCIIFCNLFIIMLLIIQQMIAIFYVTKRANAGEIV